MTENGTKPPTKPCNSLPESRIWRFAFRSGGHEVPTLWLGSRFVLFIPCAPPSSAGWSGVVGEDCLSAQREFRSRLTSRATQGTAQRRQTGAAFL